MDIWSVCNQKGGVGKTTTAIETSTRVAYHLALESSHKKVLVIDLDSDRSFTDLLLPDYNPAITNRSIVQWMLNPREPVTTFIEQYTFTYGDQNVTIDIVPGSEDLEDFPEMFRALRNIPPEIKNMQGVLPYLMNSPEVQGTYEVVILDLGPGLTAIMKAAISAARYVIVPVTPSVPAIAATKRFVAKVNRLTADRVMMGSRTTTNIAGAFVSNFDTTNSVQCAIVNGVESNGQRSPGIGDTLRKLQTPLFTTFIPTDDKAVEMAALRHRPIWVAAPGSLAGMAFAKLVDEIWADIAVA